MRRSLKKFSDSSSQSELMGAPLNYDDLSYDNYEDYSLEQMFCTFYPMELNDGRNFSQFVLNFITERKWFLGSVIQTQTAASCTIRASRMKTNATKSFFGIS